MVLYALHRLNLILQTICAFIQVFLILVRLNTCSTDRKRQSLLFYLKYIVLYELLNNPTPNFNYLILVSIIEENYKKIFDAREYVTFLALFY